MFIYYYPFYIKNINIQFFVCPPLASNTALIRLGMLSMRFRHSSVGMSRTQDDLMVSISDGRLVGCFSATLLFRSFQKFSIGLRSGLFPGHSNNLVFFVLKKSVLHLWRHSQKKRTPKAKIFFRVQTRRLAASFETFTGSVEHTGLEKFSRKATCVQAFFFRKSPKPSGHQRVLWLKNIAVY